MLCKNLIKKLFFGHALFLMVPATTLNSKPCFAAPLSGNIPGILLLHDTTDHADSIAAKNALATKITLNKHVIGFVKVYVKKEDEFLKKIKGRSIRYFQTIEKVFDQYNIPVQLKYLAVVESGLQSNARSKAGARGLWQLMPATAKELGLKVSGKNDERLSTYQSTVAAAKYLRSLHDEFGDWLLVLAAYNSGPGTVCKAMKRSGSKNYWALQSFLPAESRGHVKHFIGIHYFFEGEGSIATQTKAEAKAWQVKLCAEQMSSCAMTSN